MANNESTAYVTSHLNLPNEYEMSKEMINILTKAPKISNKKFDLGSLNIGISYSSGSLNSEISVSTSAPSVISETSELYFDFSLDSDDE